MIKDEALEYFEGLLEKFNGQISYAYHGRGEETVDVNLGLVEIRLAHQAGPGFLSFSITFRSPELVVPSSVMGEAVVSCMDSEMLAEISGKISSNEERKERLGCYVRFLSKHWESLAFVTPDKYSAFKVREQRIVEDSLRNQGIDIDNPSVWARYFPFESRLSDDAPNNSQKADGSEAPQS